MKAVFQKGFSLIELLIVIAIIGLLSMVTLPSYQNTIKKARFVEVVQASLPYKTAVEHCYELTADLAECTADKNGVPKDDNVGYGIVKSISTGANGVITIVPKAEKGLKSTDTYILTPIVENDHITWTASGGAKDNGLV